MSIARLLLPVCRNVIRCRICACAALALCATLAQAQAQTEASSQIRISAQQIERSGIRTEAAQSAAGAPANMLEVDQGLHLSGLVVAPTSAITLVSAAVSGVIQSIHVDSLQQVQAATKVAVLFSGPLMEMQREYLQLAIQARLSQQKQARDEQLFQEGIIAQTRLQDSRGSALQASLAADERYQALRGAGMSIAELNKLLSSNTLSPLLTLNAGVRGTLLELNLNPGQRIEAGMPIARISKDGALWIEFQASPHQAQEIRIGDALQLKGCGRAKVIAISRQISGANQSTLIRAQQAGNDGCLKLNQFVEANHIGSRIAAGSVGVPAAALVRSAADVYVFVRNAQGFVAVKVELKGQINPAVGGKVWVQSRDASLKAGSLVATKGSVALKGAWIGLGAEAVPVPVPAAS
ncbi:MAG: cobalt-zinc-cadmium efflux system membrane fusion protein, partial [Janthinobacterium sp.]